MTAVEELQACGRTLRERRVFAQSALELGFHRGVAQHLACDGFSHVVLHVLLAFEGVVEPPPRQQRVRRLGLQQGHHQARPGLGDGDEQCARGRGAGFARPVALDRQALVGFHRRTPEAAFRRTEHLCVALPGFAEQPVFHAMRLQHGRHPRGFSGWHQVACAGRFDHDARTDIVLQRHLPYLRRGLVVPRHQGAGHVRRRARVGVATELHGARGRCRDVGQRFLPAAQAGSGDIRLLRRGQP